MDIVISTPVCVGTPFLGKTKPTRVHYYATVPGKTKPQTQPRGRAAAKKEGPFFDAEWLM